MEAIVVDANGGSYKFAKVDHIIIELEKDEPTPYLETVLNSSDVFIVRQS